MEMNEKLIREVKKKFEVEMYKKEAEIVEYWKKEIDVIYKKKYDSLSSLQVDVKALMERMNNRVTMLSRMAKEEK
jgi:actin-like ATPase involved in cell morphogenesis